MKEQVISVQRIYTRCLRCGKPLKSTESQLSGYGPECRKKILVTKFRRKRLAEEKDERC